MAGERTIKIRFTGETTGLDKAATNAKKSMEDAAGGLDRFGEAADSGESKAQGFSDTLTGAKDTALGVSQIMKGNLFEGAVLAGQGLADLSGGIFNFVVPAMKAMSLNMIKSTASTVANTAATVAHAVASTTVSAATKTWAAIQWVLNAALLANPIVLIVAGIVLLIGVIVLIATKTDWFQRIWGAAWGWIKQAALNVWDWLKGLPQMIGDAFSKVSDFITAPFRFAFNKVADLWNGTVGKLSFSVPSWVPGIGGKGFSMPQLPHLQHGGPARAGGAFLVGEAGPEVLMMGSQSGRVIPNHALGGPEVLELHVDLGHGIQQVFSINLREHDRRVRRRARAGVPA